MSFNKLKPSKKVNTSKTAPYTNAKKLMDDHNIETLLNTKSDQKNSIIPDIVKLQTDLKLEVGSDSDCEDITVVDSDLMRTDLSSTFQSGYDSDIQVVPEVDSDSDDSI